VLNFDAVAKQININTQVTPTAHSFRDGLN